MYIGNYDAEDDRTKALKEFFHKKGLVALILLANPSGKECGFNTVGIHVDGNEQTIMKLLRQFEMGYTP